MELHKRRARCSCFHLAKTLLKVLSGPANLRRRKCLWLALQVSAPTEQNSTWLWRMCRIHRSVFGSVPLKCPFPGHSVWGSIGHRALVHCFPQISSVFLGVRQPPAGCCLVPGFHLSHRLPHTYMFAVFMVSSPRWAGQEPPALVCRASDLTWNKTSGSKARASSMFCLSFLVSSPQLMAGAMLRTQ